MVHSSFVRVRVTRRTRGVGKVSAQIVVFGGEGKAMLDAVKIPKERRNETIYYKIIRDAM
jgi:hypothetical protein